MACTRLDREQGGELVLFPLAPRSALVLAFTPQSSPALRAVLFPLFRLSNALFNGILSSVIVRIWLWFSA